MQTINMQIHESAWHTSKPGPDSDLDLDPDPKKIRTQEKPGLALGLAFKKPGLDNRKPGLQFENMTIYLDIFCYIIYYLYAVQFLCHI